jgi:hypothetical protein
MDERCKIGQEIADLQSQLSEIQAKAAAAEKTRDTYKAEWRKVKDRNRWLERRWLISFLGYIAAIATIISALAPYFRHH